MNRVPLIAAASVILAGCAGVAELRQKQAASTFTSSRSATDVATCITSAWNDQRIGIEANGAALSKEGGIFVVVSPASGYPAEVGEVSQIGSVTNVAIHAQAALDVGGRTQKRVQAAMACR